MPSSAAVAAVAAPTETVAPRGRCACEEVGAAPSPASFTDWVGRLVHEHRLLLARIARREGVRPEDAFDAVEEAFLTFLGLPAARALVDAPDDARKLLVALTRNVARNRRRLHAVRQPHDSDAETLAALAWSGPAADELVARAEDEARLRGCLASLADVQRAVVTLRMLDERPGEDVAAALGITPGHVAVLLHRAKTRLAACMTAAP